MATKYQNQFPDDTEWGKVEAAAVITFIGGVCTVTKTAAGHENGGIYGLVNTVCAIGDIIEWDFKCDYPAAAFDGLVFLSSGALLDEFALFAAGPNPFIFPPGILQVFQRDDGGLLDTGNPDFLAYDEVITKNVWQRARIVINADGSFTQFIDVDKLGVWVEMGTSVVGFNQDTLIGESLHLHVAPFTIDGEIQVRDFVWADLNGPTIVVAPEAGAGSSSPVSLNPAIGASESDGVDVNPAIGGGASQSVSVNPAIGSGSAGGGQVALNPPVGSGTSADFTFVPGAIITNCQPIDKNTLRVFFDKVLDDDAALNDPSNYNIDTLCFLGEFDDGELPEPLGLDLANYTFTSGFDPDVGLSVELQDQFNDGTLPEPIGSDIVTQNFNGAGFLPASGITQILAPDPMNAINFTPDSGFGIPDWSIIADSAPWPGGGNNVLEMAAPVAYAPSLGYRADVAIIADVEVFMEFVLRSVAGAGSMGPVLRYDPAARTGYWCNIDLGTQRVEICAFVASPFSTTILARADFNPALIPPFTLATFRARTIGNNITIHINDRIICGVTDNTYTAPNRVGLASNLVNSGTFITTEIDNYEVFSVP